MDTRRTKAEAERSEQARSEGAERRGGLEGGGREKRRSGRRALLPRSEKAIPCWRRKTNRCCAPSPQQMASRTCGGGQAAPARFAPSRWWRGSWRRRPARAPSGRPAATPQRRTT
eukprot:scaffold7803_cov200-Pinguiococcus_pyrenoidosus.AAC.1